jgi:hypothetical protein
VCESDSAMAQGDHMGQGAQYHGVLLHLGVRWWIVKGWPDLATVRRWDGH